MEIPRSDYTVDLSRVEWEGQAYVWRFTFTGVNNCTGILHNAVYRKEDLSRLSLSIDDQTFTGQEIRPEISAILDGVPLSENWNYTLCFLHNVHAGTATVILTGIGAYAGEKRVDFQILPDTVRNLDIEVDHVREIQNAQQLEDNMRVLIRATRQPADPADYIAEVVSVNLDTHRAVIRLTGKRDYTGSREFIFDIGGPREDEIRPEDSTAMYRLYNPNTGEHFTPPIRANGIIFRASAGTTRTGMDRARTVAHAGVPSVQSQRRRSSLHAGSAGIYFPAKRRLAKRGHRLVFR